MTEKRFYVEKSENQDTIFDDEGVDDYYHLGNDTRDVKALCRLLNELHEENEVLKHELKIYRKIASCGNCYYHNYDWFDDGDEFEVCDKGNDVTDGICEEWRKL